ncbi:MAG: tetratricopeptide repeat protein [Pseudobdellovibrionaceae bacterium]
MKQFRLLATTVLLSIPVGLYAKPNMPSTQQSVKDLSQQSLLIELTGKDISKENDIILYAEMVNAYHEDNEIAFKSRLQNLLKRFSQSSYADNALFLAGRMALEHNNFAEAIRYFGQIEKEYPNSNKIVSAKFAKAMTYKRMNLPEFASRTLQEIKTKYPGSPESFRADAELKVIKQ